MNLVGGPGGKAPGSSCILGFLRLKSIMIMLYLNFKFIYYTHNWSKYCSMSFFSGQNLSLYNPGASGWLCPPGPPTRALAWTHWGPWVAPRPLAEIVWYLLHSRKYLQPKKIVKPLPLVTMITAAILNFFQPHKSCHTLRWVFLQSFMKFDERNPKSFLNPPFFLSVATAAKFVQPIPIFLAYLVTLDVDVVPIKFHQFLLGE